MALDHAISWADRLDKPLVAYFGLTHNFPEANLRHYTFLVEGLRDVEAHLKEIGVKLVVQVKSPELGVVALSKDACIVVVDKGYQKTLTRWYRSAAANMSCPLVQVEDNVVVPVESASNKEEYSAATLRPKINRNRERFLQAPASVQPKRGSLDLRFETVDLADFDGVVSGLGVDVSVKGAKGFLGGNSQAVQCLEDFVAHKLPNYPTLRNDPTVDFTSNLSPYLHFGQISPVQVTMQVLAADAPVEAKEAFLEEF